MYALSLLSRDRQMGRQGSIRGERGSKSDVSQPRPKPADWPDDHTVPLTRRPGAEQKQEQSRSLDRSYGDGS